ncbi:nucleotidyltransferase domain-containing protein [Treponema denticola]|uniref:nucleotidyltransferase domain-containing protein n=1 Tax=Treponema denticola TaxID=158 RepID=UPI0021083BC4|nr:nucleotidyltransferase domain-containing protein [Treponema denticola]
MIGILQKYIKSGEVIVFGSRVIGTNTERSDIDIALNNIVFFSPYSLGDLIDEIAEPDFPYLADVVINKDITNPALKVHIDRVGRGLVMIGDI